MFLSTAITLSTIFISPVWAQLNMAWCPAGFDWNKNSLGQDPCTVSSILDASCRSPMEYTYPPLTDDSTKHYLPPRANNPEDVMCDCNTVMYSLYMACASCQGGKIYSWMQWISECPSVHVSQYPANIPQGTTIPHWAYYDITVLPDQTWNDSIATSTRRRHPKELLKRADPTPSSDPSAPPPSSTPPPSSSSTPPPLSQGKTTSIRVPSGPQGPTTSTNPPDPTTSPSTRDSPGPGTPTSNTDPSGPTIESTGDSTNPPRPTNPTGNSTDPPGSSTNLPGSGTIPTGSGTNPTGSGTNPTDSGTNPTGSGTNSLRPTNSAGSITNSLQPTNPAGSNTNSNGSNAKGGINVWALVFVISIRALM